jgi:hypothetical protein
MDGSGFIEVRTGRIGEALNGFHHAGVRPRIQQQRLARQNQAVQDLLGLLANVRLVVRICQHSPPHPGTGNLISFSGSNSVTAEDFTLLTFGGPPNKFGIFFYGENATQIAFGNGFRCVGGALVRLPATQIDDSGNASLTLDFDNLPNNGPIDAGDIKLFQFWYRDPMAGGAFFNLSDGLRVEFCP